MATNRKADKGTEARDVRAFYNVGEEERALADCNKHFFILDNGQVVRDKDVYGHACPLQVLSRTEFTNGRAFSRLEQVEQSGKDEKKKKVSTAAWWYSHSNARRFERIDFDPAGTLGNIYNTWQGFAVEPRPGDWSLMAAHIRDIIAGGNPEWASYIERWLAWSFQNPDKAAEVALALRGLKGCGKGTLFNAVLHIGGAEHALAVNSPGQFLGRFNGHLANKVFLFADEAFWAGDQQAEGKLKALVTEPRIAIEAKYKDIANGVNRLSIMIASNSNWVVPATPDERRYAVFDVLPDRVGDHDYFAAIHEQMAAGGYAAMLYDLQGLDLGKWHPRLDIPRTPALRGQVVRSEGAVRAAIREMLEEGVPTSWGFVMSAPGVVVTEALASTVKGKGGSWVDQEVGAELLALGGVKRKLQAGTYGRKNCYVMPPLAECRKRFDPGEEWPGEPAEWTYFPEKGVAANGATHEPSNVVALPAPAKPNPLYDQPRLRQGSAQVRGNP